METTAQIQLLKRAHSDLGKVLQELGVLRVESTHTPKWKADTERQWRLLRAVVDANTITGGDVGAEEWTRLGEAHGYDPRGLGGFFRGAEPLMAVQGERRVMTEHGLRFVERWEADFSKTP